MLEFQIWYGTSHAIPKGNKTSQNAGSVIRPQYSTVKTPIAMQHIRLCVQVYHVKQGTTRLVYSTVSYAHPPIQVVLSFFFLTKTKNMIKNQGNLISQ